MPLTKLQFKPGINRETTSYSNEGGWYDGDKIRFRFGYPEKIGGWEKKSNSQFLGVARALHPWVALDSSQFIGVGTNLKYYVEQGGGFNDITPIRAIFNATTVEGVSATGGVGTVDINPLNVPVEGVSATGVVGTAEADPDTIAAEGVSATGAVGTVDIIQSQIVSFGEVGTVTVETVDGGGASVPVTT